jgi:hypothetical protein
MPPLPAAPGVVKVSLNLTVAGDAQALCRFYVHYTGTAPTGAQLNTFCAAVGSAWGTNLAPLCLTDRNLLEVTAEDLSTNTGAVGFDATAHNGSLAHHTVPAATTFNINFLIARRYRGGKPKIFLPLFGAEDLTVGNLWGGAAVTSGTTGWAAFIAAVLAAGWAAAGTLTHVNVSYYSGFTVVTNPITHRARNVPTVRVSPVVDPIITYGFETAPGSQRRRNQ